jgi:hypothetical protein
MDMGVKPPFRRWAQDYAARFGYLCWQFSVAGNLGEHDSAVPLLNRFLCDFFIKIRAMFLYYCNPYSGFYKAELRQL